MNLKGGESRQLAELIRRVARPVDPRDVSLLEQWLKRLEGGR